MTINLKYSHAYAFKTGMHEGNIDAILGNNNAAHALRYTRFKAVKERKAFIAGYNLGNTGRYWETFKNDHNALNAAIINGDVIPVDFKMAFNGWQLFEEKK